MTALTYSSKPMTALNYMTVNPRLMKLCALTLHSEPGGLEAQSSHHWCEKSY